VVFDELHTKNADPWDFETSAYEAKKREATIAALGGRRFNHALEIGCSIGVLTQDLSAICDELVAVDVSAVALEKARQRLGRGSKITFRRAEIPGAWPEGRYDLIVLSEVLYFLAIEEIEETSRLAQRALSPGGVCLLVNWVGPTDLPIDGRLAAHTFRAACPWTVVFKEDEPSYRIELLRPVIDA
jgi:SAM-dependent methyltransferase